MVRSCVLSISPSSGRKQRALDAAAEPLCAVALFRQALGKGMEGADAAMDDGAAGGSGAGGDVDMMTENGKSTESEARMLSSAGAAARRSPPAACAEGHNLRSETMQVGRA